MDEFGTKGLPGQVVLSEYGAGLGVISIVTNLIRIMKGGVNI